MATRSWNRVELIGNLTRDPEMRYTPSGSAVCTFSIATNRTFVSDGEKREEVDFHRIVSWNKLAELCSQLLKKGNRVFVSGRLQNRSWEGQDGQSRNVTEIVIEDMIVLTSRGAPSAAGSEDFNEDVAPSRPTPAPTKTTDPASSGASPEVEVPAEVEAKPTAKKEAPKEDVGDLDDLPF